MADVVPLKTVTAPIQPVDEQVVKMAEELLERAKSGEIQGIAYATVSAEASGALICCGSAYGGQGLHQNVHAILGGVDVLKERLMRNLVQWD